ncbi:Mitoc-mL59 domain-containing protein [Mycena kentingensis (nom. inval.)]|nr:Mitoc-mL59 domain-containing protein [Mycena kentingensis (nom. inval.)]
MSATRTFLRRELRALPRYVARHGTPEGPKDEEGPSGMHVLPNPFLPRKNSKSGRWAPPKYSLRQQADIIKQAKLDGSLHLLPPSVKLPNPALFTPARLQEAEEAKAECLRAKMRQSNQEAIAKVKADVKKRGKKRAKVQDASPEANTVTQPLTVETATPPVNASGPTIDAISTPVAASSVPPEAAPESSAVPTESFPASEQTPPQWPESVLSIAGINLQKVSARSQVFFQWDRRPAERVLPGADIGTRLYAKKRQMFKGSKLERTREHRAWRTWVLLRDMRKRIRRYRTHYAHKKPNPLKPTRTTQKKLPY